MRLGIAAGCALVVPAASGQPRPATKPSPAIVTQSPSRSCCTGTELSVGIPMREFYPFWSLAPPGSADVVRGHVPELMDMLSQETGVTFTYENASSGQLQSVWEQHWKLYNASVVIVTAESFDVRVTEYFTYTAPLYNSRYGAAVLKRNAGIDKFRLFDPFTTDLWGMCVVQVFTMALLVILLRRWSPPKFRGDSKQGLLVEAAGAMYHSVAFILGGEDIEWFNWAGRVLRITNLFGVLIITSTYTANLAAFFTVPSARVYGPQDMRELRASKVCQWYTPESVSDNAGGVVTVTNPIENYVGELIAVNTSTECAEMLKANKVDAWVDDAAVLNEFVLRNCDDFYVVPSISMVPIHGSLRFPVEMSQLAANLSAAIVHLLASPRYQDLLARDFSFGRVCPERKVSDTAQVDAEGLSGLFMIVMFGSCVALCLALWERRKHASVIPEAAPQTEGEMLHLVLRRLDEMQRSNALARAENFFSKLEQAGVDSASDAASGGLQKDDPGHDNSSLPR